MPRPLPPAIQRLDTAAGWKLTFPWRAVPAALRRKIHQYLLGGSLALLTGLALLAVSFATKPPDERAPLIGLFMMAGTMALYLMAIGVNHIWTRSVVEVSPDGLRLIEQQGLFRRVRNRPWLGVRKLVTHHIIHVEEQRHGPPTETGALEVVGHGAQTLWFAHDYPREWLLAVGEHLAEAGKIAHEEAPWATKELTKVQAFFQNETADENTFDVDTAPPDSRCQVDDREGVVTLLAPAPPFWKSIQGHSTVALALVTLGFAVFTVYAVWNEGLGALNMILPIGLFFLIGGGLFLVSSFDPRLWIRFRIDAEHLIVVKRARFGKERKFTWPRGDIAAVRAEEIDPNDSECTAMHLKLIPTEGAVFTCLAGREPQELWWIATVLRRALDVPAVAGHSNFLQKRNEQGAFPAQ